MAIWSLVACIFLVLLDSCSSIQHSQSEFPIIKSIIESPIAGFGGGELAEYVLIPDGSAVYNYYGEKISVEKGEKSKSFLKNGLLQLGNSLRISPNGQYLSGFQTRYGQELSREYFIFNIPNQTSTSYQIGNGYPAISWSPNSSRFLVNDYATLVSVPDMQTTTSWNTEVDFKKTKNTYGDGLFLWDADQNIPVASISGCGLYCLIDKGNKNNETIGWTLIPITEILNKSGHKLFEPVIDVPSPNAVVDISFDPSGRYILFVVWEQLTMPDKDLNPLSKNVTDSILLLVDWRTKKSTELLRLSNIDKQRFVVQPDSIRWSSDGSTILIPREDAEALVLKLKYP